MDIHTDAYGASEPVGLAKEGERMPDIWVRIRSLEDSVSRLAELVERTDVKLGVVCSDASEEAESGEVTVMKQANTALGRKLSEIDCQVRLMCDRLISILGRCEI